MTDIDIHSIMTRLSEGRKIFHSEADFQHALAWQIRESTPECEVRPEFNPIPREDRRMSLDIWLPIEKVAIELKYGTRRLEVTSRREHFVLRDQNGVDVNGYGFLKDIERLEREVEEGRAEGAFAILLTNDQSFWKPSQRTDIVGSAFRIHEGKRITGEMSWSKRAAKGTTNSRETTIKLKGSYRIRYRDYSKFAGKRNGVFRYIVVPVVESSLLSSGTG